MNFEELKARIAALYADQLKPKFKANPRLSRGIVIVLSVTASIIGLSAGSAMVRLAMHSGKADQTHPVKPAGEPQTASKSQPPSAGKTGVPARETTTVQPRPANAGQPVTPALKSPASSLPLTPINPALVSFQPTSALLMRGPENPPRVALTFDAGSDAKAVSLILKTLEEHHVHATFFLTGRFCEKFPNECRAIADAGMELGNHSYSHPMFTRLTEAQIQSQLDKAEEQIVRVCGRGAKPLFRFPYGDCDNRTQKIVAAAGYQPIRWTLDSLDAFKKPKTADFVVERINSRVKPGYITLMHVSCVTSAEALPRIFEQLDKMGAQVVPVSELLLSQPDTKTAPPSTPPDNQPPGQ